MGAPNVQLEGCVWSGSVTRFPLKAVVGPLSYLRELLLRAI